MSASGIYGQEAAKLYVGGAQNNDDLAKLGIESKFTTAAILMTPWFEILSQPQVESDHLLKPVKGYCCFIIKIIMKIIVKIMIKTMNKFMATFMITLMIKTMNIFGLDRKWAWDPALAQGLSGSWARFRTRAQQLPLRPWASSSH